MTSSGAAVQSLYAAVVFRVFGDVRLMSIFVVTAKRQPQQERKKRDFDQREQQNQRPRFHCFDATTRFVGPRLLWGVSLVQEGRGRHRSPSDRAISLSGLHKTHYRALNHGGLTFLPAK